ncbi:hypothetical protein MRX96_054876 [Rhipicephalus microplus]
MRRRSTAVARYAAITISRLRRSFWYAPIAQCSSYVACTLAFSGLLRGVAGAVMARKSGSPRPKGPGAALAEAPAFVHRASRVGIAKRCTALFGVGQFRVGRQTRAPSRKQKTRLWKALLPGRGNPGRAATPN